MSMIFAVFFDLQYWQKMQSLCSDADDTANIALLHITPELNFFVYYINSERGHVFSYIIGPLLKGEADET